MTISKDAAGNLQFGGMVVDVVIWLQQRLKFRLYDCFVPSLDFS